MEKKLNINSSFPKIEYSTDNAAMIALAGFYKYQKKRISQDYQLVLIADTKFKIFQIKFYFFAN